MAPRNKLEQQLAAIWQEVLHIGQVGVYDNFFALGGHSLIAIQMMTQLRQKFDRDMPLSLLFENQTIAQFATVLDQQTKEDEWSPLVAIETHGTQLPFFCVHGVGGNSHMFYPLAHALKPRQPFYGLQARGIDGFSTPLTSVEEMATDYIHAIQAVQPHGPYVLGRYSLGGQIAFEMAQQLQKHGETVAHLILLDAPAPTQINQMNQTTTQADWLTYITQLAARAHDKTMCLLLQVAP